MRKLVRRPSPAMIVACIALLVALGGTSMAAATQLARNSVGTPQLRDGAVTNPKIRNNAVNSAKVANRSLLRADFAPGKLPAGRTGPKGPPGPAGAAGAAGPAGPAGLVRAVVVRTNSVSIADGAAGVSLNSGRVSRNCDSNERAISAGVSWSDDDEDKLLFTQELEPTLNSQGQVIGFVAVGGNDSGETETFTVHVLCYVP